MKLALAASNDSRQDNAGFSFQSSPIQSHEDQYRTKTVDNSQMTFAGDNVIKRATEDKKNEESAKSADVKMRSIPPTDISVDVMQPSPFFGFNNK